MSVIVDFSMFPLDKGESLSSLVTRSIKIIDNSGLGYHLHAMGTSIEGEWDEVMDVVTRCFEELKQDCSRVYMGITGDYRKIGPDRIVSKVESVESKL